MSPKTTHLIAVMKKAGIVMFDIAVLALLVFLATVAAKAEAPNVKIITTTDDVLYLSGDDMAITFQVENYTGSNLALSFNDGCQLGIEIFKFSVDSNGYTIPVFNEFLYQRNCSETPTTVNIPDGKKAIWNRTLTGLKFPAGDYAVHAYVIGYEGSDWALQGTSFVQVSFDIKEGTTAPSYDEKNILCKGTGGNYDTDTCSCSSGYSWSEIVGCQKDMEILEKCIEDGKFIAFSTEDTVCIEMGSMNPPFEEPPFNDIENHWAKNYIENLYVKGVVKGYEDGSFKPDSYVNRAELTKMALSAAGIQPESPAEGEASFAFEDVEGWQIEWVYPAWKKEIIKGYSDSIFSPGKNITRAEALKISLLAFEVEVPDTSSEWAFSDTIGHWAISYINYAYLEYIVSGKTDDLFYPDDYITRAEAAKVINNLLN